MRNALKITFDFMSIVEDSIKYKAELKDMRFECEEWRLKAISKLCVRILKFEFLYNKYQN